MTRQEAENVMKDWLIEKRYGIFYKGKILYISTVNVYINKIIARSKLKNSLGSRWVRNPDPLAVYPNLAINLGPISDKDLDEMIADGTIEIREIK